MAVTLKDIAAALGYSVNTVSRAMRGCDDIPTKTREKIRAKANEMGYIVNRSARYLRSGKTKTLAVLVGSISNPHFSILINEMEERAADLGYTLFIMNTREDPETECNAIRTAISLNVDGMLICPCQKSEASYRLLQENDMPFVLFGRRDSRFASVIADDVKTGYMATWELIQKGHRRIAFLGAPTYISSAAERLQGYRQALAEAGITEKKGDVCMPEAQKKVADLLKDGTFPPKDVTATVCFSDISASAYIYELTLQGKRVPEDMSVIGVDNIQSRVVLPRHITSIQNGKRLLAKTAFDLLISHINGETDVQQIVLDVSLSQGDTVAQR